MLKVILSVLLLALVTTLVGYQQLQATITSPLNITTPTQFEVKKGMGFNQLCKQWQANNWLKRDRYEIYLEDIIKSMTLLTLGMGGIIS